MTIVRDREFDTSIYFPVSDDLRRSRRRKDYELDTFVDSWKDTHVTSWIRVSNPVIATCRACGYRGHCDEPTIGLY